MVTADEAIKSGQPKDVKRARASISAQITCDINLLKRELAKELNGDFDYEKISPQLIKIQKKKLSDHFELIQKLHEKYLEVREEGVDDEAEQLLMEDNIRYMDNIT